MIPNEKLLAVAKDAGFFESFRIADDVLRQGVQGISDIITIPGVINRDFADVKTTMAGMGYSVMGTAVRSGENRAREAAMAAMASPLLEAGAIDGARGILINITGSSSLKLSEVNEASTIIQNAAHEDANIIFGAVQDENMGENVKITVIATGFRDAAPQRRERMLSEASLPTLRNEPMLPRVEVYPPAVRFASEGNAAPRGSVSQAGSASIPIVHPQARGPQEQTPPASPVGTPAAAQESQAVAPGQARKPFISPYYESPPEPEGQHTGFETEDAAAGRPAEHQERGSRTTEEHSASPTYAPPATSADYRLEGCPQLIPVPASVFDDDFFRKPNEELRASASSAWPPHSTRDERTSVPVKGSEDAAQWTEGKVPSFAGVTGSESDELDIPAFLRRNH